MLRNYFLLNVLLVLVVLFLGQKLYNSFTYTRAVPQEAGELQDQGDKPDVRRRMTALDEAPFEVISQLDLFRPSRSASQQKGEEIKEDLSPKELPKLFGTIILNDEKTAILEEPDTKKTKIYRLNDLVAGFTVSDILEDKVVLLKGVDKYEVKLREEKGVQAPRPQTVQQTRKTPQRQETTPRTRQRRPRRVRRNTAPPPPQNPSP